MLQIQQFLTYTTFSHQWILKNSEKKKKNTAKLTLNVSVHKVQSIPKAVMRCQEKGVLWYRGVFMRYCRILHPFIKPIHSHWRECVHIWSYLSTDAVKRGNCRGRSLWGRIFKILFRPQDPLKSGQPAFLPSIPVRTLSIHPPYKLLHSEWSFCKYMDLQIPKKMKHQR